METKITISTTDQNLVHQILDLIKGEQATYQLETAEQKSNEKLVDVMDRKSDF
ncbi:hypothetical protein [Cyclobacterium sp. SYSU L10401]|uniref:hypothetical protein n=1 Tax=Cyclobacterium sp. SYSU L10401 TaxID=2678657 RepID=UPI0013D3442E|nr:hypothetical protein [Cyclobacterium sp. SYSU L10401]